MQAILRVAPRAVRGRLLVPAASSPALPRLFSQSSGRCSQGSYGGSDLSGHEQSDKKNPMSHMEHPGPESPASKGSSSSPSESSGGESSSSSSTDKGSPAIHQPESAAEKEDPEVRQHNEEMRNRAEKSSNQLSEKDNKVDSKFWTGDVGTTKKSEDSS